MSPLGLILFALFIIASNGESPTLLALSNGTFPYTPQTPETLNPADATRNKRSASSPFVRDEKCKISYEEMTSIADLLKMYANGQATADVPFSAATTGLNTCQQAMEEIKTTANKLINISNQIKSSGNSISTDEYMKLRSALEETNIKFQQQLNHVKQQATQDAQIKIKEIETEKHELKASNNKLMQDLEDAISKHQSDILSLTASEIYRGNIGVAINKFFEMKNDHLLDQVIVKAYDIEKIPNILQFIDKLPWLIHRAVAYRALVSKIESSHHDSSPMGLLVLSSLEEVMANKQESHVRAESQPVLNQAKNALLSMKSKILTAWAQKIRSNDLQQIIDFANSHGSVFNKFAEDLVKRAYEASDDIIMKILSLSNQLRTIEASGLVYVELYYQMKTTQHINYRPTILMAHKTKELMRMPNYKNVKENLTRKLSLLWDEFPYEIRAVVSGDSIYLANDGFQRYAYLYVKDHYDNERDIIYTTEKTDTSKFSIRWKFEVEAEKDGHLIFRIKSDPNDDYLYAAGDYFAFNQHRRRVFSWRSSSPVSQGKWDLEDSDWINGKFYLRNIAHNEYLDVFEFADESIEMALFIPVSMPNGRRNVHTVRSGARGENPVWKIKSNS